MYVYVVYCFPCFYLLKILEDNTILVEPLIKLFWISVDVCPQFQNRIVLLIRVFPKVARSDSDARIVLKLNKFSKKGQL